MSVQAPASFAIAAPTPQHAEHRSAAHSPASMVLRDTKDQAFPVVRQPGDSQKYIPRIEFYIIIAHLGVFQPVIV